VVVPLPARGRGGRRGKGCGGGEWGCRNSVRRGRGGLVGKRDKRCKSFQTQVNPRSVKRDDYQGSPEVTAWNGARSCIFHGPAYPVLRLDHARHHPGSLDGAPKYFWDSFRCCSYIEARTTYCTQMRVFGFTRIDSKLLMPSSGASSIVCVRVQMETVSPCCLFQKQFLHSLAHLSLTGWRVPLRSLTNCCRNKFVAHAVRMTRSWHIACDTQRQTTLHVLFGAVLLNFVRSFSSHQRGLCFSPGLFHSASWQRYYRQSARRCRSKRGVRSGFPAVLLHLPEVALFSPRGGALIFYGNHLNLGGKSKLPGGKFFFYGKPFPRGENRVLRVPAWKRCWWGWWGGGEQSNLRYATIDAINERHTQRKRATMAPLLSLPRALTPYRENCAAFLPPPSGWTRANWRGSWILDENNNSNAKAVSAISGEFTSLARAGVASARPRMNLAPCMKTTKRIE